MKVNIKNKRRKESREKKIRSSIIWQRN